MGHLHIVYKDQTRMPNIKYIVMVLIRSKQVLEKAFHKNAKTCRAGFHKKPTKQDGTHMTIRSQITIPTSISPGVITCLVVFWGGFNPYMSFHF